MPHINGLPNELLFHIWSFLDARGSDPPSVAAFEDEPSVNITATEDTHLKTCSRVCKRWRKQLLPELFRYTRLRLDETHRWLELTDNLELRILRNGKHHLLFPQSVVDLLDRLEELPGWKRGHGLRSLDLESFADNHDVFHVLPDRWRMWMPSTLCIPPFLDFLKRNDLERKVHSLVVYSPKAYTEDPSEALTNKMYSTHETFWNSLLAVINPTRIVLALSPTTMAALTDGRLATREVSDFGQPIHYLELRQAAAKSRDTPLYSDPPGPTTCKYHRCLHNLRAWTHIGYNEGSYLQVYNTYEFFNKHPAQVLPILLKWLHKESAYAPPRLASFAYRAIFPFSSHVESIMFELHALAACHKLASVELCFGPIPRSGILEQRDRVRRADLVECWSEVERAYQKVTTGLAQRRRAPGMRIVCLDYENKSLEERLDVCWARVKDMGWSREGDAWVFGQSSAEE